MQLPTKIERWITADVVPQRLMLTGNDSTFDMATEIATRLQNAPHNHIQTGTHPDTLILKDDGTFRIGDHQNPETNTVRGMIRWAHQKPTSPYRIILFENFERISRSAIQATLKLLEEPPTKTIFLITTANPHQLLDTILSRVTTIRLPHNEDEFTPDTEIIDFLEGKNLLQSFRKIEELDKLTRGGEKINRQPIITWIDQAITHARKLKHLHPTLNPLLETRNDITSNLSIRFTMERLALKLSAK